MRNETELSLNTLLGCGAAVLAALIVVGVGTGALDRNWGLAGGLMIAVAHGLAMRHWIRDLDRRERNAFELGRESVPNGRRP